MQPLYAVRYFALWYVSSIRALRMIESSTGQVSDKLEKVQKPSLLRRVLKGAAWTFGGHMISQVIRLANNLVLSRLLFPEAFGLMALVYTFISGLHLLSDTGTEVNIIQSKRGDDQAFLNTAWTVDCIRGCILWLCACLISVPVANFYNEPILVYLLPISGLTTLIGGFKSNKLATANRNLNLGRLTVMGLIIQVTSTVVTLVLAVVANRAGASRDVAIWALVAGNIVASILELILSYTFIPGENNWFQIEREALVELFKFGRWIFLSTLLTFFAFQGSNLLIPRLVGVGFFGIFSFASNLSQLASNIVLNLGGRVLFPSFSELHRDRPERLYPVLRQARILLNGINCIVALIFIFFGQLLISVMYDERYADAGWILQILALGSIVTVLASTYSNVLLAQGKSYAMTVIMFFQTGFQFTGLLVGYYVGGNFGLVVGTVLASWATYPVQAILYSRLSIWQPEVDLPIIAAATGIAAFVFLH